MLQHVVKVGSIIVLASASISAMEKLPLKNLAIQKVAELAAHDINYCVKVFNDLPCELGASLIQQLAATDRTKSALPIALLSYKINQQPLNSKQYQLRLLLANNQPVELTPQQSNQLIRSSATIQNFIQDLDTGELSQEIPLPLTQEQVTTLLSYVSSVNALNTSDSTLPMLQQDIPETSIVFSSLIPYIALYQLKEYLAAQTIPTLCDLLLAASYLDIQSEQEGINFIELATHAISNKLVQAPQYQEEYSVINTLPATLQRKLAHYIIDNSTVRYTLCSNSTHVITNTTQTLSGRPEGAWSVVWSPDGKYIAGGSYTKIKIWDAHNDTCIHTLDGHDDTITSVAWSPDGTYIASCSWNDKSIKMWNGTTGNSLYTLTGHNRGVKSVAWSPDSRHIVSGSDDNTIRVWDITNSTCIHTLFGHTGSICSVSWSPDGKYIASSSSDKTIKVWDAITGNCIRTLLGHTQDVVTVSWSRDGSKIASSGSKDNTIRVWDAQSGTHMHTLTGHENGVTQVSWSPNSQYIVSGSWDQTIKLWDASTGACIHTLKGHSWGVNSVSWSPDGRYIASNSNDNTIKVWNIIDSKLDNYLKNTLSWKQALLLIRIINAHNTQHAIDFNHDIPARQCYKSLSKDIKQLVRPSLPSKTCTIL